MYYDDNGLITNPLAPVKNTIGCLERCKNFRALDVTITQRLALLTFPTDPITCAPSKKMDM